MNSDEMRTEELAELRALAEHPEHGPGARISLTILSAYRSAMDEIDGQATHAQISDGLSQIIAHMIVDTGTDFSMSAVRGSAAAEVSAIMDAVTEQVRARLRAVLDGTAQIVAKDSDFDFRSFMNGEAGK